MPQTSSPKPKRTHKADAYSAVLAAMEPCTKRWTAFAAKPPGVSFETQGNEEQVLLFLRQHPIVNIPWVVITVCMLLAPPLLLPFFAPFSLIPVNYQFVLFLGWYLLTAGFVVEKLFMWLFNCFIITDERMVDIDIYSLIFKEVNYAHLEKIQDITVKTGGVLNSLVDIGSVFVQTASEVPEFVFDNIEHPDRVAKMLNELLIEEQREEREGRVS